MVVCSALLLAALFSLSVFTSSPSAHASTLGMNPHTTPAGATAHIVANTTIVPAATSSCPPTLYPGSPYHQWVRNIQSDLRFYGYYGADGKPLKVDGIYGKNTEYAVRNFQFDEGITIDGIVGPHTWAADGYC